MEQEEIKQLLERYWQCETSLEDEQHLQEFFSGNKVPGELEVYQPLFTWRNKQKKIQTDKHEMFGPKKPRMEYFYPTLKIAASVLIVLTFGISVYTYYQQEKFMDKMFSGTYVESVDSVKESGEVVAKVLSPTEMIPETIEDSLKIVKPELNNLGKGKE
jgi:hypothetical protein